MIFELGLSQSVLIEYLLHIRNSAGCQGHKSDLGIYQAEGNLLAGKGISICKIKKAFTYLNICFGCRLFIVFEAKIVGTGDTEINHT